MQQNSMLIILFGHSLQLIHVLYHLLRTEHDPSTVNSLPLISVPSAAEWS